MEQTLSFRATSSDCDDYVIATTKRVTVPENLEARSCFACGGAPSSGAGEHVVPLWLQGQFKLHNERLELQNKTLIPYRQLTIPCCESCNTGFLSEIERQVQSIVASGQVSSETDLLQMGRWMAKIFIGILVKEMSLLHDRSDPTRGRIISPDWVEDFHHCHLILQSARKTSVFECIHSSLPFSIYWYQVSGAPDDLLFDITTNIAGQSIALRVGRIGVVFINDGGLQMEVGPKGPHSLAGAIVSPIQFSELAARIHYKASLRDASHFYLCSETPTKFTLSQQGIRPFSSTRLPNGEIRIFKQWEDEAFALMASRITRLDQSVFLDPTTGRPTTTLWSLLSEEAPRSDSANG